MIKSMARRQGNIWVVPWIQRTNDVFFAKGLFPHFFNSFSQLVYCNNFSSFFVVMFPRSPLGPVNSSCLTPLFCKFFTFLDHCSKLIHSLFPVRSILTFLSSYMLGKNPFLNHFGKVV